MKTAIRIVTLACVALISSSFLYAQKSGVFKTYADYKDGKMEYGINCATESHKIKLNDFWGNDYITVIHDGKPYNLKKAEIWGYQLCDEKVVRFQGKEDFSLADKGVLWIYSKQVTLPGYGRSSGKLVTTYSFSKGGDGEIRELTLVNLEVAFPDNHKLHDALNAQFKSDQSLSEFDEFHKQYKINHFLNIQGVE